MRVTGPFFLVSEDSTSRSSTRSRPLVPGNASAILPRPPFSEDTGPKGASSTTSETSPGGRVPGASSRATSSAGGRRAKTSPSPDAGQAWGSAPDPASGVTWPGSSESSDPRSSLLRILRNRADGGSLRSRQTWPRSGMGGLTFASELPPWASDTSGTASSSLLPTLTTTDAKSGNARRAFSGGYSKAGKKWGLNLRDVVLLPTLTATDARSGASNPGWRPPRRAGSLPLRDVAGGMFCPRWCERFMGFPEGWTQTDPPTKSARATRGVGRGSERSGTRSSRSRPTGPSEDSLVPSSNASADA